MQHRSLLLALVTAAALTGAASAVAGAAQDSWYVAPQAFHVSPDGDYNADDSVGASIAFGKVLSKAWDLELGFVDSRHDVSGGGNELKLNGPVLNLKRVFMRDNAVNPFIGIGADYLSSRDNGVGKSNRGFGGAVMAGALADMTSDGALQLSAELGKRFMPDSLNDVFVGLGLRFNFGGAAKIAATPVAATPSPPPAPMPPPPPADSDHDGVLDTVDQCPNTVAGAVVDAKGCELDGDRDGVVDRIDKCPTTPAGDKVDAVGCSLSLKLEVQFDTNSATIKPDSHAELDRFVKFMTDVPSAKGIMEGHTDSVGNDAYNLKLSQRRADSIKTYLVGQGVEAARIGTKGYGETKPVADNATETGRAANRRVVFVRTDVTQ